MWKGCTSNGRESSNNSKVPNNQMGRRLSPPTTLFHQECYVRFPHDESKHCIAKPQNSHSATSLHHNDHLKESHMYIIFSSEPIQHGPHVPVESGKKQG